MKISIITINYKDLEGLKKTVKSVVEQIYTNIEYIVIDGNSQDGTSEFLQHNNKHISYWISEPDKGIYNAMNKGIERATGDYLLFINSGDLLYDNKVLKNIVPDLISGEDFIVGNLFLDSQPEGKIKRHPIKMTMSFLFRSTISHPSSFIKREVFVTYGLYDEKLKIVSDWKLFFVALALNGATYKSIDILISKYDVNGISSQEEEIENITKEKNSVLNEYLKPAINNDMDAYILNHFSERSKRFNAIYKIDKSPFIRKITTVILQFLAFLSILSSNSKK